eukprot:TRINITY_DN983_c0_g1_i4.p1 TRINITY_DN983_c0_g1~~TRINITY_DN983_c0_g1_i4.p1  ORF type:complete len:108 (-),score=30.93 TRINITY_DN983_c0_g1_i4:109-432(-)
MFQKKLQQANQKQAATAIVANESTFERKQHGIRTGSEFSGEAPNFRTRVGAAFQVDLSSLPVPGQVTEQADEYYTQLKVADPALTALPAMAAEAPEVSAKKRAKSGM